MTIKGFTDSKKTTTVAPDYATLQPVSPWRYGLDVAASVFYREVVADAAEAGSTLTTITATAHVAKKGDLIAWSSGALAGLEFRVSKTTANEITVGEEMPEAPAAADDFSILRAGAPRIDATGGLATTFSGDLGPGAATATTLRTVLATDQTAIPVTQSGAWTVTIQDLDLGPITVDATDLDFRDLDSAQDSVSAVQSGAWTVTVTATNLDIRDLSSASDSVAAVQSGAWNVADITGTVSLPTGAATAAGVAALRDGRTYVTSARHAYSGANVTTGAWTELVAATGDTINELHIFDSSGQTLELGVGAAASEARRFLIPPGGFGAPISLQIASGSRIAVRAVSGNATSGELTITMTK